MLPLRIRPIVIVVAVCALGACDQRASPPAGGNNATSPATPVTSTEAGAWVNNGASACDKYLTPEVTGAVFKSPAGQSHPSDSRSCSFETAHPPNSDFSTINIYLRDGGADSFDTDSTTKNGTPLQGVGDKAVRTLEDGVQAVKGERICSITVKPPFGNKIKGDEMAQKLGQVCTQLFALP